MRIALLVYGSLDVLSGGNLYDRKLVDHLRSSGHDVDVIELSPASYASHVLQNLSRSIRERVGGGNYDLLLQDELVHPSLFSLNRTLRRVIPTPFISIVHHLLSSEARPRWKNAGFRVIEKAYLQTVDAFVFNSETTKRSVERVTKRRRPNVVATPGGDRFVDAGLLTKDQLKKRAAREGPLRLLFVGNLIPRKGLHTLLRALERLGSASLRLDVVGATDIETAYAASIQDTVTKRELTGRITLHGRLDGDRLAELYRESQLFVLPSTYEGFGIVYLEAMGFGLPILACDSGATSEIVGDGVTGILVPPEDDATLATHLETLDHNRERLTELSIAARDAFSSAPTWHQSMERIERFLCTFARR